MRIARAASETQTPGADADVRIPVYFYNDEINQYWKHDVDTNDWIFTGYTRPQDSATADGRYVGATFGVQILAARQMVDARNQPTGWNLLMVMNYDELLDTSKFNPHHIHDRGLRFIASVIKEMKMCGRYALAGPLDYSFIEIAKPEQVAMVEMRGEFRYFETRR